MATPTPFTANEVWTLGIAGYGAVVATFVLGWDAFKYLNQGPKLEVSVSTNMLVVGSNDDKLKILVTAVNLGDRATTITNMGGAWYSSRWRRLFRPNRNQKAFIVTMPSQAQVIPFRLEPGAQWMGMADQTEDVVKMIREGLLYMTLWTAHNGRGTYVRIHPKQLKQSKAKDDA